MEIQEMIKMYDNENQFKVLQESYYQVESAWQSQIDVSSIDTSKIKNIVLSGLGGSAIGGDLLQNFFRTELKYPYVVNRNYELPPYADESTLVIASSYSGNTEETLAAANEAIQRKCQVACITTGGKLEEFALKNKFPLGRLMKGYQPRFALWVNFFTLLKLVQSLKLIPEQNEVVNSIIGLLKRKGEVYSQTKNDALDLAQKFIGYIPLIYAVSEYTSAIGARYKGQFNENSKLHSFYGLLPELDHNEILGWDTFDPKQVNLILINIMDEDYHPQVKKRYEITSEIIRKKGCEIINISSKEKTWKERLVDIIYFGDWISYYLAVIRGINPTSIDNINYLKERL
ncbi:MAG TPA: bifunctional phosphoglucose/phosphomannose isomerase [Melioribacteraceae bacterium]|nr:bifunctional phosphoglucose/phosphomannose isomerase [Melioribacteraceae bacterium]